MLFIHHIHLMSDTKRCHGIIYKFKAVLVIIVHFKRFMTNELWSVIQMFLAGLMCAFRY